MTSSELYSSSSCFTTSLLTTLSQRLQKTYSAYRTVFDNTLVRDCTTETSNTMYNPTLLFQAPEVNPVNHKARSIPALNPVNMYGRVWFFSWFGFFIAFWSWYAFPPLLTVTIAKDLNMSTVDVLNSNIVALVATLLVRLAAGPACDKFGPRWTFAGCLFIGAIPTFLAGTCYSVGQLMAVRFFVGILGGSFVPCQVWSTGFFDKNIVGTSNAFVAGFGNAGGGIVSISKWRISLPNKTTDLFPHASHLRLARS